jgi:hypothetical protein
MRKDENGSHVVGVLLLVLILGVVGFAGYQVMNKNKDSKNTTTQNSTEKTSSLPSKVTVIEKGDKILPNGYADPTVAKTATGYRMYVNRQSGGPGGYLTYISTDGIKWEKENDIVIPQVATARAVEFPGGIRMYYPGAQPINPSDPVANMFSSFTTDGVSFTKDDGIRLEPKEGHYLEGPTVFQLADKSWRMYFNENTEAAGNQRDGIIWGANSPDGLAWTRDAKPTIEYDDVEKKLKQPWAQVLHPFVLKNPDGGYIMLYNSHSEVFAAVSEDGIKWEKLGDIGLHGADVDGFYLEDGNIRLYYGDFSEQTGGLVYTALLKVE